MGAGAHRAALVCLLQQLGTIPGGLMHQDVTILPPKYVAPMQHTRNALQCHDLGLAVGDGFLIQDEGLQRWHSLEILKSTGQRMVKVWPQPA